MLPSSPHAAVLHDATPPTGVQLMQRTRPTATGAGVAGARAHALQPWICHGEVAKKGVRESSGCREQGARFHAHAKGRCEEEPVPHRSDVRHGAAPTPIGPTSSNGRSCHALLICPPLHLRPPPWPSKASSTVRMQLAGCQAPALCSWRTRACAGADAFLPRVTLTLRTSGPDAPMPYPLIASHTRWGACAFDAAR